MQKHRKWLVVTIWISTIAFVGAGGIWAVNGNISFSGDSVAKVGDIKISNGQYQRLYSRIYGQYMQDLQGNFDEAKAKELGLPIQALQHLIGRAQLLSFAKDLGLQVSDEEILQTLQQTPDFQVNGAFDKATYTDLITKNGWRTEEYEKELSDDILVRKLYDALNNSVPKASALESLSLELPLNIQDRLEIKVLTKPLVTLSEAQIKEYWESHKDKWQKETPYNIEFMKFLISEQQATQAEIDEEANEEYRRQLKGEEDNALLDSIKREIAKTLPKQKALRAANRAYTPFSDGEISGSVMQSHLKVNTTLEGSSIVVKETDIGNGIILDEQSIESLKSASNGQVLKPIEQNDGFVLLKLQDKTKPTPKEYDEVKNEAKVELMGQKQEEALKEEGSKQIADFKGIDVGFYSLSMESLNQNQAQKLQQAGFKLEQLNFLPEILSEIFSNQQKSGFVNMGDFGVLYRIIEQQLDVTKNLQFADTLGTEYLNQGIFGSLLEAYINEKYKPQVFFNFE